VHHQQLASNAIQNDASSTLSCQTGDIHEGSECVNAECIVNVAIILGLGCSDENNWIASKETCMAGMSIVVVIERAAPIYIISLNHALGVVHSNISLLPRADAQARWTTSPSSSVQRLKRHQSQFKTMQLTSVDLGI